LKCQTKTQLKYNRKFNKIHLEQKLKTFVYIKGLYQLKTVLFLLLLTIQCQLPILAFSIVGGEKKKALQGRDPKTSLGKINIFSLKSLSA